MAFVPVFVGAVVGGLVHLARTERIIRHLGLYGPRRCVQNETIRKALEQNENLFQQGDAILHLALREYMNDRHSLQNTDLHDLENQDAVVEYYEHLDIEKYFQDFKLRAPQASEPVRKAKIFKAIIGAVAKDISKDYAVEYALRIVKACIRYE